MKLKLFLAGSFGLNIVLVMYLFQSLEEPTSGAVSDSLQPSPSYKLETLNGGAEKMAYLASLKSQYNVLESTATDYWLNPATLLASQTKQQITVKQTIRKALLDRYGIEATEEPLFQPYFYPLGVRFDFLTSENQIIIDELRSKHRVNSSQVLAGPNAISTMGQLEEKYLSEVSSILGADSFFEFNLRESRLAHQLRLLDFNWSEQEFREVFEIRNASQDSSLEQPRGLNPFGLAMNLYDDRIKQVLGEQRYLAYLKVQDPVYQQMKLAVEASLVSTGSVDEAYSSYVAYEELIIEARKNRDASAQVRQLRQERDQVIKKITGVNVASHLGRPIGLPRNAVMLKR